MTRLRVAALFAASAVGAAPVPLLAQSAGDGFLFKIPVGSWGVRGGFDRALAGSDLFSSITKDFTLNRSDFSSATLGSYLAIRVSPANDVVVDFSYASVSRQSEYRDWVDQNNLPIQQTTSLRRIPITVGIRHYLGSRGHSIGRFAWIPTQWTTYVGAGAGLMRYQFRQVGDFVDPQSLNVRFDELQSAAWTPVVHALVGADFALGHAFLLTGEARYTWARGPVTGDYFGFNRIDLSGLSATAGFAFRL